MNSFHRLSEHSIRSGYELPPVLPPVLLSILSTTPDNRSADVFNTPFPPESPTRFFVFPAIPLSSHICFSHPEPLLFLGSFAISSVFFCFQCFVNTHSDIRRLLVKRYHHCTCMSVKTCFCVVVSDLVDCFTNDGRNI